MTIASFKTAEIPTGGLTSSCRLRTLTSSSSPIFWKRYSNTRGARPRCEYRDIYIKESRVSFHLSTPEFVVLIGMQHGEEKSLGANKSREETRINQEKKREDQSREGTAVFLCLSRDQALLVRLTERRQVRAGLPYLCGRPRLVDLAEHGVGLA